MEELDKAVSALVFDSIAPREVLVRIAGTDYILREATEAAACVYRNASASALKVADGEVVGMGNVGDVEPLMVSMCLYEAGPGGVLRTLQNGTPDPKYQVNLNVVRNWPARVVRPLFAKLKEISELDEPESLEQIDKAIARLQKRRAKFASLGKGELSSTEGTAS